MTRPNPLFSKAIYLLSLRHKYIPVGKVNANSILLAIHDLQGKARPERWSLSQTLDEIRKWIDTEEPPAPPAVSPFAWFARKEYVPDRKMREALDKAHGAIVRGRSLGIDRV